MREIEYLRRSLAVALAVLGANSRQP